MGSRRGYNKILQRKYFWVLLEKDILQTRTVRAGAEHSDQTSGYIHKKPSEFLG